MIFLTSFCALQVQFLTRVSGYQQLPALETEVHLPGLTPALASPDSTEALSENGLGSNTREESLLSRLQAYLDSEPFRVGMITSTTHCRTAPKLSCHFLQN